LMPPKADAAICRDIVTQCTIYEMGARNIPTYSAPNHWPVAKSKSTLQTLLMRF